MTTGERKAAKIRTVKARGIEIGSGRSKICVPLTARSGEELEEQLAGLRGVPFDMLEWRADFYSPGEAPAFPEASKSPEVQEPLLSREALREALAMIRGAAGAGRPVLFTFRTREEGGERDAAPESYDALVRGAADTGEIDLADLELRAGPERLARLTEYLHGRGVSTVLSSHDFAGTPSTEEMVARLRRMQELGADITKLAVMPKDRTDVARLLEAACIMNDSFADRPCVTMSMGPLGALSRVSGCLTGSAFTFGTAGQASAPGQLPADVLHQILGLLG